MRQGLVSVVIPAYQAERYVGEAIASAQAQEGVEVEVIVVDDGSTDGTRAAVERHAGVRYLRQANAGIGPARNAGVLVAEGEFLAFLDADDLWTEGRLARQVALLRADPSLDMVFGHAHQFADPEHAAEIARGVAFIAEPTAAYIAGTMLILRSAFERVGPFPSHLEVGEFVEWYLRAVDLGLSGRMDDQVVLRRRIHLANTGILKRDARLDYVRIVKASLDRRRAREGG
jgi:glycosyltransferase involved in cell wall biosynthesis